MKTERWLIAALAMVHLALRSLAVDASYYGLIRLQQYQQTPGLAPTLFPSNAYAFNAFAVATTNGAVTNVTFKPATAAQATPLTPEMGGATWRFTEFFNTQSALDAKYPLGSAFNPVNYTMTIAGVNDGIKSASLNFFIVVLPIGNPATPQISNLVEAQNIDSTRDFTLRWNSLGGGALDIVQLIILDAASNAVYSSPAPFQTGALDGSSTSLLIPAKSLPPDSLLIGHLTLAKPGSPNTSSYAGATGVPAKASDTMFPLVTRSLPAPPKLEIVSRTATALMIRFVGETNRNYRIQAGVTVDQWQDLLLTNLVAPAAVIEENLVPGQPRQFYRVLLEL